nr:ketol-acid reductoisomerase [Nitrospirota bacterium]
MKRLFCVAAILGLFLAGCQSGPHQSRESTAGHRFLVTKDHVRETIEHEKAFAQYYDVKAPAGENWFAIDLGTSPVLIVAGHATAQTREGKRKAADRGTGSLAVMLHKLAGATAIYTVYESPSDPNYDDDNTFKETLSKLLQEIQPTLVLDLHTSHADRPYAVDFGTMDGKSLLERSEVLGQLEDALRGEGVQDFSNEYFPARHHHTITKWVSGHGVPCIQLEINSTWLVRAADNPAEFHRFAKLLQGLVTFLQGFEPPDADKASTDLSVPVPR